MLQTTDSLRSPWLQERYPVNPMSWRPATKQEVESIVAQDVGELAAEAVAVWEQFRVEPYQVPLTRYGKDEMVFVVARKGNEVIYWEDVEEGFNISPLDGSGRILEHWCNQDPLKFALQRWVGEGPWLNCGPAIASKNEDG